MTKLKDILAAWKMKEGTRQKGRLVYYIPGGMRVIALHNLLKTLRDGYGYTRDQFTDEVKDTIVNECVSHGVNSFKLAAWKDHVRRDLEGVINKYLPPAVTLLTEDIAVVMAELARSDTGTSNKEDPDTGSGAA